MGIVETTYTALTGPQGMYRFLVDMVAQGWEIVISSDGTTYNGSGNQISHNGSGAGGINNQHAYAVLRQTGAPDWLVQRATTQDIWNINYSPSAAYTGGNATTRPTAGDEASAWSEFGGNLFVSVTFDVEIHVEDVAPFRWALRTDDGIFVASVGSTTRPMYLANLGLTGAYSYSASQTDQGAWEDVESLLTIGGGGEEGPTALYSMTARDPDCGVVTYCHWTSSGTPDFAAAQYGGPRCGGSPLVDVVAVRLR